MQVYCFCPSSDFWLYLFLLLMPLDGVLPGHKANVDVVLSRSKEGRALLQRSLIFLMKVAAANVHKNWFLTVEHDVTAGPQYDGVVCNVDEGAHIVTKEEVDTLKKEIKSTLTVMQS